MNGNEYPVGFSPDGLTEQLIDVLLREVEVASVPRPRLASVAVEGQAAQRRYRRKARRGASAVVRALPVRGVAFGPDGLEAA